MRGGCGGRGGGLCDKMRFWEGGRGGGGGGGGGKDEALGEWNSCR